MPQRGQHQCSIDSLAAGSAYCHCHPVWRLCYTDWPHSQHSHYWTASWWQTELLRNPLLSLDTAVCWLDVTCFPVALAPLFSWWGCCCAVISVLVDFETVRRAALRLSSLDECALTTSSSLTGTLVPVPLLRVLPYMTASLLLAL